MDNLVKLLEHNKLDFKTESQLTTIGNKTSFFHNLNINKNDFIVKKTAGLKLSYDEWVKKSRSLEHQFRKIEDYISKKKNRYISKLILTEQQKVISSFSKLQKLQFNILETFYRPESNLYYDNTVYPVTLDGYLQFICDTADISYKSILPRINNILWLEERDNERKVSRLSILRLLAIYKNDILSNMIDASYHLSDSSYMLIPFLKRSELKSFVKDPRKLHKVIKSSNRYGDNTELKLTKTQVVEFTEFYLKSNDKRLNTTNIIRELVLHLLTYNRSDLIDKLCLKHHRFFSSVIAGKLTRESYSYDTLRFLRKVMSSDGYNSFDKLISADVDDKIDTSIRFVRKESAEVAD